MADVSPYTLISNAPQLAGQCEAYVEQQLLGHTGAYPSAIDGLAASDFVSTSNPAVIPAGVAVVFAAAPSNKNYGHVGVSLGNGRMRSVWSNGNIEEEPISRFVTDNGAALLGYHRFGLGVPASSSASSSSASGPSWPPAKVAAVAVLGAIGVALVSNI